MANFDDFKQKAKNAVETIADVSVEVYKKAEEKAKVLAKTTKLSAEITREKSLIRRLYTEIGKTYYEANKNAPATEFEQNCSEITTAFERIASKRQEIEDLRKTCDVGDEEIEIEIILDDDDDEDEQTEE